MSEFLKRIVEIIERCDSWCKVVALLIICVTVIACVLLLV